MSETMLTDGSPVPEDRSHTAIDPATGMQKGYVVLSPAERAKGFVKPVRRSYLHVGAPTLPPNLRDLTAEELKEHGKYGYVKYEVYGEDRAPLCGKYWTQKELDRAGKRCGGVTTMGTGLAETYARDPHFYSGTFCCHCGTHFPLNEFTWEPDGEPMDPELQEAWHVEHDAKAKRERAEYRHRRIAELTSELERLRAEDAAAAEATVREFEKAFRACDNYSRPEGIMGGPCLNCGCSQPEHVR